MAAEAVQCTCAGTNFGSLITALYGLGLFLGTIYSVPPLHLKRFAQAPAFMCFQNVATWTNRSYQSIVCGAST